MRPTPPERIAEARRLHAAGRTQYQIAVLMGTTVGAVKGMLYPRKEKRMMMMVDGVTAEPKFCKDCKHYAPEKNKYEYEAPMCRHQKNFRLDVVLGNRHSLGDCWEARRSWCGIDVPRGWEAK